MCIYIKPPTDTQVSFKIIAISVDLDCCCDKVALTINVSAFILLYLTTVTFQLHHHAMKKYM